MKKRSTTLPAAELQSLIEVLSGDLARLRQTVAELARYTATGFRAFGPTCPRCARI